jgi:hypothetical protein
MVDVSDLSGDVVNGLAAVSTGTGILAFVGMAPTYEGGYLVGSTPGNAGIRTMVIRSRCSTSLRTTLTTSLSSGRERQPSS